MHSGALRCQITSLHIAKWLLHNSFFLNLPISKIRNSGGNHEIIVVSTAKILGCFSEKAILQQPLQLWRPPFSHCLSDLRVNSTDAPRSCGAACLNQMLRIEAAADCRACFLKYTERWKKPIWWERRYRFTAIDSMILGELLRIPLDAPWKTRYTRGGFRYLNPTEAAPAFIAGRCE